MLWNIVSFDIDGPRPEFTYFLREILSYEKVLTNRFYLILRNVGWVSFYSNVMKYISNRARYTLVQNFIEIGKICGSKLRHKIRTVAKLLWIQALICHMSRIMKFISFHISNYCFPVSQLFTIEVFYFCLLLFTCFTTLHHRSSKSNHMCL